MYKNRELRMAMHTQGTYNGLGTVWKRPSKQLLHRTLLLRTIFCSALSSFRRPPTSPSNVVAKKSTHFHPFCSKFNFVWGGRGGVASFSNITGKVPTLLTSIVGHWTCTWSYRLFVLSSHFLYLEKILEEWPTKWSNKWFSRSDIICWCW